ncbi:hypothetical protein SAMN04488591_0996 [Microbacterium azadirachtae]|uniref:Lipoprotein n=1 Tax=Microbacterium azadirachtae TaxID=582680 RepID=A0A1I6GBX0_9MICO|nr:hypothetical protein [Microbacterium azadirachtae]SFR39689.1 hypothetical protein SAMN04488591_0996 [Microbacterium azadirachtae]
MRSANRVLAALGVTAVALAGATACSSGRSPAPATSSAPGTRVTASPTPSPDATDVPAASPRPLDCETLIPADTVAALHKQGWSAVQRDFAFGPDPVPGGIACLWADPTTASDHGLLYGWAPISGVDAAAREAELVSEGWIREDSDRGVYITADPRTALSKDADGYGMTYLFGRGWASVSDTKQGLILIDPKG